MIKRAAILFPILFSACAVSDDDASSHDAGLMIDVTTGTDVSAPTWNSGGDAGDASAASEGDEPDGGAVADSDLDADAPALGQMSSNQSETDVDGAFVKDGAVADVDDFDSGGKPPFKGVAGSDCAELVQLNVAWWYDWELGPTGCTSTPFVPMIWGHGNEQTSAGIVSEVGAGVAAGYRYVLGFNEPDNASQSNISVAAAISLWPSFNNPAVLIGSPATQGNATGLAWIQDFMTQVNADTTGTLRVDFIATHWYGWNAGACDPAANTLESWIAGIEAIPGNRPIWLTEWGCQNQSNPSAATVEAFYAGALAMFAKHPRVVRYAWYQWITYNELVDADSGALTTLGASYADAAAFH
jgi:hypothetical protein